MVALSEERVGSTTSSSQPKLEYYWVQQLPKGPLMHSLHMRTAYCLFYIVLMQLGKATSALRCSRLAGLARQRAGSHLTLGSRVDALVQVSARA
jgi:hypothetical protein